jgi:hypothetical protein
MVKEEGLWRGVEGAQAMQDEVQPKLIKAFGRRRINSHNSNRNALFL